MTMMASSNATVSTVIVLAITTLLSLYGAAGRPRAVGSGEEDYRHASVTADLLQNSRTL